MNNFTLIREIIGKTWAIDAAYALFVAPAIQSFLENAQTYPSRESENNLYNSAEISVIEIKGELLKNDTESGRVGMATIAKQIEKADQNPDIKGHILVIDSPGGTFDGTMELVSSIEKTQKPTVALIDGMAASGAYWIASATDKIISQNPYNKVGSIGVMLSFADMQPMYEKAGVKFHRIYAKQSPDKNKVIEKLLAGDYEEYIESDLNPLAEEFINRVKNFRPYIIENQLTGKIFFAKDVIGTMVDEIGTFQDAVNYINSYSQTHKSNNMFNKDKQKDEKIAELMVQLNEANQKIAVLGQNKAEFQSENLTLTEKLAEIESEIENLKSEIADKNALLSDYENQIEKLKQADGAETAKAVKETDAINNANKTVTSENLSMIENIERIKENYL